MFIMYNFWADVDVKVTHDWLVEAYIFELV